MTELTDTLNNGETEVLVVPTGEFYGSDSKGNPIPESIDEQVIDSLEEQLQGKELLVDKDHSSVKEGNGRDTSAMGWMHSFKKGVEGLWAKIRWTNIGRNLVENRVFRFLSPVFTLKGDKPTSMLNVALTNQPAFQEKAKPIINNQPTMEEIEMTMTKEELVSLIKETVAAMNAEPVKEEVKEVVVENECSDDKAEKPVENECEKDTDVVKNEDTPEEVKEEVKEEIQEGKEEGKTEEEIKEEVKEEIVEEKKEESDDSEDEDKKDAEQVSKKKEEVIKLEALNSTPKTEGIDIVKNFAPTQTSAKGYAITTIIR